ncbi:MAG: type IV secretion system DNA-binding domain-containing protein [Steroidobacteraceae bacterium]
MLLDERSQGLSAFSRWIRRSRAGRATRIPHLTLAGCRVPWIDETKHFKVLGTTGTGKSTAIREVVSAALLRGDRAVIADPDGSYQKRYYTPARGDQLLNPFNPQAARWDLFAEIEQLHDADQLARSLIPDHPGPDENWRNYARTFVTSVLRQLHRAGEADLAKLYWLLVMAPVEVLKDLLAPTPAGPFLGEDNGKFFESVRSVTTVHVAAIEHLARQQTGIPLCVRAWIREGKGALFLPYRAGELASLRNVISTWMRLAMFEVMNAEEGDQKLWFVIDELDALGPIDGLKDALARLRKFGGRCILGFQSIAQVRGTYGDPEAQTIVENCGNTLILRCSASERGGTAEFVSRLIGRREILRPVHSETSPRLFSNVARSHTVTRQYVTEDAVMASEIEQLPDLTGYLKFASGSQWRKVHLS